MTSKLLPENITSYDLIKTFAVVTMIIDHIGLYFFPEISWWRCIGRMSFPVWLFLIGYAESRDIPKLLWGGAIVLILSDLVVGRPLFSLNMLVGIICVRLLLDRIMQFIDRNNQKAFWPFIVLLIVLSLPSHILFDYGFIAFLAAILGYMVRHSERYESALISRYMFTMFGFYLVTQCISFALSPPQLIVLAAGTFLLWNTLVRFSAREFPDLSRKLPSPVCGFLKICGRRTLEIYILHLLVFKFLASYLGIGDFQVFAWTWI